MCSLECVLVNIVCFGFVIQNLFLNKTVCVCLSNCETSFYQLVSKQLRSWLINGYYKRRNGIMLGRNGTHKGRKQKENRYNLRICPAVNRSYKILSNLIKEYLKRLTK